MENKIPLVSVIVPNFNHERYLEERLESIQAQSFRNFEVILLDDASKDYSVDILETYSTQFENVTLQVNKENSGSPFKQWMKGIRQAKGEYCWIAETDDVAASDFLATCIQLLVKHPDCVLCYTGSTLIDENGIRSDKDVNHWTRNERNRIIRFNGQAFAEQCLYWKNYIINASACVFKTSEAQRIAEDDWGQFRYCGDWLFWYRLARRGDVLEICRPMNLFRQHPAKATVASNKGNGGILEDIKIIQYIERELPDIPRIKKRVRRGMLYGKILRNVYDETARTAAFAAYKEKLRGTRIDYYIYKTVSILKPLFKAHAKQERKHCKKEYIKET